MYMVAYYSKIIVITDVNLSLSSMQKHIRLHVYSRSVPDDPLHLHLLVEGSVSSRLITTCSPDLYVSGMYSVLLKPILKHVAVTWLFMFSVLTLQDEGCRKEFGR